MVPQGILETVVYCSDLDAARVFYEQVVGLQIFSTEPGRHLFYKVGNSMLLVFNPQNTSTAKVEIDGQSIPLHGAKGACHVAFQSQYEQFDAIKANLKQHGVAIESEIDWPGGGHSIYCRDPAANSVEFATRSLWFSEASDP
ncbi:MAG: glyoxalase/bleomycin resistance/extradiol dioxygenase family protein [Pirellulaceae bacterium]|nr:glyoxalase/bleomycin resistance/extradiol dioxygenase family protein [Pirellulaceae bacterium]